MRARLLTLSLLLTLVTAVQGQTSADSVALVVDACNKALEERDRGNVGAAASLLEDVWPIVEALPAGTEDVVCHYFSALSCMYAEWGDYNGALKIELELTEYTRRRWGTKSEEWAVRLLNLAESYATTGDNTQAIKCSTEARKLLRKLHGEYHPLYYTAT